MRPKITIPPCRYCGKAFQRTEHLRRHERTHTKEKPFACPCGRSFSRKDLLARHEKVSHPKGIPGFDSAPDASDPDSEMTSASASASYEPAHVAAPGSLADEEPPRVHPPWNPLDAAERSSHAPAIPVSGSALANDNSHNVTLQDNATNTAGDDLDFLWANLGDTNVFTQQSAVNYPLNILSFPGLDPGIEFTTESLPAFTSHHGPHDLGAGSDGALTRYGSRLPSPLEPGAEQRPVTQTDASQPKRPAATSLKQLSTPKSSPWRISQLDYNLMRAAILQQPPIIFRNFTLPSRHAIVRFVEGYFEGFHEHLPFLHLPTICIPAVAPELMLAITAVGANYRYQRQQSRSLSDAAKALIAWRIDQVASTHPGSSDLSAGRQSADGLRQPSRSMTDENCSPSLSSNSPDPNTVIQLLQAIILIIALGTWNDASDLRSAISLGTQLAFLVRESGLSESLDDYDESDWSSWCQMESSRRTKLVAYCFLNLHSLAYNCAPQLTNHDILLDLPCAEALWRAKSAAQWQELYRKHQTANIGFQAAYQRLFEKNAQLAYETPLSSFSNYILIHSILQHIFFTRQLMQSFEDDDKTLLTQTNLDLFGRALNRWQSNWEATEDSSIDPSSPSGPLSFNSTALFRMAYARLHTDLGVNRLLETRDPTRIAQALGGLSHIARSVHVCRAVLQCAHSLSIPIRIGVEYVSRTQTLSWSIIHSLCNLECATFLSQWLDCISTKASQGHAQNSHEIRLLNLVESILRETEASEIIAAEISPERRYKRMAITVLRICSQILSGPNVWDVVGVMSSALDMRAKVIELELAASSHGMDGMDSMGT